VDQLQQHVSFELMKELRHVFVYHHWLIITFQEELMIEGDKKTIGNILEFVPLKLDEIFAILVQQ
jgi:hypothetical protein